MTKRSRRLRKKLHIDEFKELGFGVKWSFIDNISDDLIDIKVDQFIKEVIEPNDLAYEGSGYLTWQGIVCTQKLGNCTEAHRQLVLDWLEKHEFKNIIVTNLVDIWWDNLFD